MTIFQRTLREVAEIIRHFVANFLKICPKKWVVQIPNVVIAKEAMVDLETPAQGLQSDASVLSQK